MAKVRTFIDANVLILAARGKHRLSATAIALLDDASRSFVTSDFIKLEVLPKAKFHGNSDEAAFYEAFFSAADRTISSSPKLVNEAMHEAVQAGLSAVDALHVAAAKRAKCREFVTMEKSSKPLFRVQGLTVNTLHRPAD